MMDAQTRARRAGAKTLKSTDSETLRKWDADITRRAELTGEFTDTDKALSGAISKELASRLGVKTPTPTPTPTPTKQPSGIWGGIKSAVGLGPQTYTEGAPAPVAQPAPKPAQAQQPRVWMINPAGKRVMIEGSIDDALKAGYKLVQ